MQIADDRVVLIHYTLTNDAGETLDSSAGSEPLAYLHGRDNLIRGLESKLTGRVAGDKLDVRVAPGDGYGHVDPTLTQNVPRSAFPDNVDLRVGMRFQTQSDRGPQAVVVAHVSDESVRVDANHPLAGQYLNFAVEITDVREASDEELAHTRISLNGFHEASIGSAHAELAAATYLTSRAASIYGGSHQVQRNIIAKAVLGL